MARSYFPYFGGLTSLFLLFSRVHVTLYPTVSVRWSIGWSIGRSIDRSVDRSVSNAFFLRFPGSFCIFTPAQLRATDPAVYMVLLYHECAQPNRNSLRTVERLTA